ncbi:MAG: type I restriction enzyme HsdR N-terminal domain-containing protein [Crocinitomicaceae bacterium]|nr:type I restriction enzyme HsdR N-terminal domain-containing protein [Crocinitomicaceae bacterium]
MYPNLNLPEFDLKIDGEKIWDVLRKKYVQLTPEEWVRQNFIQYLIQHKDYPAGRMVSEYTLDYNGMKKRCDVALFNQKLGVDVIVECKAPGVVLNEDTFYQIAKYTSTLEAPILILTNGIEHYCAFVDVAKGEMRFLKEIPDKEALGKLLSN